MCTDTKTQSRPLSFLTPGQCMAVGHCILTTTNIITDIFGKSTFELYKTVCKKYNISISGSIAAVGYRSGTRAVADASKLSPLSEMAEGSRESTGKNH